MLLISYLPYAAILLITIYRDSNASKKLPTADSNTVDKLSSVDNNTAEKLSTVDSDTADLP